MGQTWTIFTSLAVTVPIETPGQSGHLRRQPPASFGEPTSISTSQ
jgi:hypothetical protein